MSIPAGWEVETNTLDTALQSGAPREQILAQAQADGLSVDEEALDLNLASRDAGGPVSGFVPPTIAPDGEDGWEVEAEEGLEGEVTYDPADWVINDAGEEQYVGPEARENTGDASAMWSGMKSGALRGWDDEWQALFGAVGNKIGSAVGMNETPDDVGFWDIYDVLQHKNEGIKNDAWETNPVAYGTGFVPGMLMGPSFARLTRSGGTIPQKVAGAMGIGAIEGGVTGAGNSEPGLANRLLGGVGGAAIGAATAPLLLPLTGAITAVGSRVKERLTRRNHLNSGLEVMATRAPQDEAAMLARVDEMEAAGVPPRMLDVVDESGRGVVRTTANKMTPARQELADHANVVYESAQDRVAEQARRNISREPRTARQLARQIKEEQDALGPQFDAVRGEPVPVTQDIIDVLSTREGLAALRSAEGLMIDKADRAVVRQMIAAVRQAEKLGSPEDQARKLFPGFDRLAPEAQQQMLRQLDIKDPMADITLTVDIADKFARAMKGRSTTNPGLERVATAFGNTVRNAARVASKGYDDVMDEFQDIARVGEAAGGTGRFENTDFLRSAPDDYAHTVSTAERTAPEGAPGSERDMLAIRARDDVVDRATQGSGADAMGVARTVARGSAQRQRNETQLGEEGARRFESGMREEVGRVDNTRFIDPRIGSQTQPMRSDDEAVGEIGNFVADSTRGLWGTIHGAARWLRGAGIRGVDAERLTRDAISEDPQRVRDAIAFLTQKGMAIDRARSFVRALGAQMAGRAGGAAMSGDADRPPPNSVRSILREGGQ